LRGWKWVHRTASIGLRSTQHAAHLPSQRDRRKRLLQKCVSAIENSVPDDGVVRVPGQ
jgi:hypothetical protein